MQATARNAQASAHPRSPGLDNHVIMWSSFASEDVEGPSPCGSILAPTSEKARRR